MRKISALLLAIFVGAFVAGCGKSETPAPQPETPKVDVPAPPETPAPK